MFKRLAIDTKAGPDKFYIYFRHTPQGMKMFPSYELSPAGQPKTLITPRDPNSEAVTATMNALVGTIKHRMGGFNPRARPDMAKAVELTKPMLKGVFLDDMIYLRPQGKMGESILCRLKSQ